MSLNHQLYNRPKMWVSFKKKQLTNRSESEPDETDTCSQVWLCDRVMPLATARELMQHYYFMPQGVASFHFTTQYCRLGYQGHSSFCTQLQYWSWGREKKLSICNPADLKKTVFEVDTTVLYMCNDIVAMRTVVWVMYSGGPCFTCLGLEWRHT